MSIDKKASYYDAGGIETVDIIKAKLTEEQYIGYLLGNVLNYSCTLNHKGCAKRDAEKIAVYAEQLKYIEQTTKPALAESTKAGSTLKVNIQSDNIPKEIESLMSYCIAMLTMHNEITSETEKLHYVFEALQKFFVPTSSVKKDLESCNRAQAKTIFRLQKNIREMSSISRRSDFSFEQRYERFVALINEVDLSFDQG